MPVLVALRLYLKNFFNHSQIIKHRDEVDLSLFKSTQKSLTLLSQN